MRWLTASTCLALLLAAWLLNQSAVHWGGNLADGFLFGYSGWQIRHGARPYADLWDNKPPGIWWTAAAAQALLGDERTSELAAAAVATAVTLISFVWLARLLYGPAVLLPAVLVAAGLLTHVRYECGAFRTETFVTACECTLVAFYVHWLRSPHPRWLLLAGLAAGTGPWFKQSGIAAASVCGLHLLWMLARRRASVRSVACFLAGCAAPSAVAVVVLAMQGVVSEWWYAVVGFNRLYFEVRDAAWLPSLRTWRYLEQPLAPLMSFALLALVGLLMMLGPHRNPERSRADRPTGFMLIPVWTIAAGYLVAVSGGVLAYHLSPLLPPLTLAALAVIGNAGEAPFSQVILRRPSTAVLFALLAGVSIDALRDSISLARTAWNARSPGLSLEWRDPPEFVEQAAYIRAHTGPSDTIYVWGWDPGLYRYAQRRCCSRFATLEKVSQVAPRGEFLLEAAVFDIQTRRPAMFIISAGDHDRLPQGRTRDFADWLAANYEITTEIRGMRMLCVLRATQRNGSAPAVHLLSRLPPRLSGPFERLAWQF